MDATPAAMLEPASTALAVLALAVVLAVVLALALALALAAAAKGATAAIGAVAAIAQHRRHCLSVFSNAWLVPAA